MSLPTKTLQELILGAQRRCDQQPAPGSADSDFVDAATWEDWINGSLYSLYDELITAYGNDYYVADPYEFTTDGTSSTFDLPTDFYKLLGVDLVVSGGGAITLQEFAFSERNQGGYGTPRAAGIWGRGTNQMKYRLRAGKIWLRTGANQELAPEAGQTIRLYYIPKLQPLVPLATITFDPLTWGHVDPDTGLFPATGYITFNGYTGTDQQVDLSVWAANTATQAATNVATTIQQMFGTSGSVAALSVSCSVSVNVITLSIPATVPAVTVSSDSSDAVCSTGTIRYGATSSDGISGWLDYVEVDTAIKAATKEESSIAELVRERDRLQARIIATAPSRNASGAGRVADVRGELDDDFAWER